jgi:hypothetical protein
MDEFAHIHPNFIESFFRSTYPTVSSSKVSRIIITSTPNGMNKFYEIYRDAVNGDNSFNPIRVDWWQVPGRDEEWKKKEISNLGSQELFNQEYGNQFLSSSTLLLGSNELKKIKANEVEYEWREIDIMEDLGLPYGNFRWHPKFQLNDDTLQRNRFVLSVDLAGGGKGDFTVLNIFKVVPLPKKVIEVMDDFQDESDFFGLLQVGIYRDNEIEVEDFKKILESVVVKLFNPENVRVLLEINFKGELLIDKLTSNDEFPMEIFVHTKHTESARMRKPGIKYNEKNKMKYCEILRSQMRLNRVIVNESSWTIPELFSFGLNGRGTYSSQSGHDDVAMSIVNLSGMFESSDFYELVGELYDDLGESAYRDLIDIKLEEMSGDGEGTKEGGFYSSFSQLL